MVEYKLVNAIPRTYVGYKENHFGYLCEVRKDGVWVSLDPLTAQIWLDAGRIHGPLRDEQVPAKVEKAPEPVVEAPKEPEVVDAPVAEEVPQTMTQVMEEGSGKRVGRPKKAE